MAAIDTLNTNISNLVTVGSALTAAVATIPTGTVAVGGASETQVQAAADAVATATSTITTAVAAIQAAVTPPVVVPTPPAA